jgi:DNA-binding transcriptional MerR regulator
VYTIKQASLRSGVPVQLLRAWERRYGVVQPDRSLSGYRLYDDAAIARLRAMRALIADGWSAAQAARAVVEAPAPLILAPAEATTVTHATGSQLVDAAARYDHAGVERALDEMFGRGSFEAVIDDLVLPGAAALGPAWAEGRIDVAAEHLASGARVRRRPATAWRGRPFPRLRCADRLVGRCRGDEHRSRCGDRRRHGS